MSTAHRKPQFRVGDRVRIPLGPRTLTGRIVEDRGAIGVRGRRLYRVSIPEDPFEPRFIEIPEDELEMILDQDVKPVELQHDKVIEYLTNGGLLSILMANTGGKYQPRVWLCLDSFGNPTHTFDSERGLVGGDPIPFLAWRETKIFTPEVEKVREFLTSFDLSKQDIDKIISEIGTAP